MDQHYFWDHRHFQGNAQVWAVGSHQLSKQIWSLLLLWGLPWPQDRTTDQLYCVRKVAAQDCGLSEWRILTGLLLCKSSGAKAQLERVLGIYAFTECARTNMYHVITILHKVHIVLYAQLLYSIAQLWCNAVTPCHKPFAQHMLHACSPHVHSRML